MLFTFVLLVSDIFKAFIFGVVTELFPAGP